MQKIIYDKDIYKHILAGKKQFILKYQYENEQHK